MKTLLSSLWKWFVGGKEEMRGLGEMLNDEGMTGVRQILNIRIVCFNF